MGRSTADTLVLTSTPLDACVYGSRQIQDFSVAALLTVEPIHHASQSRPDVGRSLS